MLVLVDHETNKAMFEPQWGSGFGFGKSHHKLDHKSWLKALFDMFDFALGFAYHAIYVQVLLVDKFTGLH